MAGQTHRRADGHWRDRASLSPRRLPRDFMDGAWRSTSRRRAGRAGPHRLLPDRWRPAARHRNPRRRRRRRTSARKVTTVWHTLATARSPPWAARSHGRIDWDRRHALMRTHTALHVLCGVIWNEWGTAVTGGNMEPLTARMDFEFDPLPGGVRHRGRGTGQRRAGRGPARSWSASSPGPRRSLDADLIRTKVNLIPESVAGDPGRRHRGPRQAGRRRDPRPAHRRGRAASGC